MKAWNQWRLFMLAGWAVLMTVGCRGIPDEFQGEYEDKRSPVRLNLDLFEGRVWLPDGRSMKADVKKMEFDELAKGRMAIYAREHSVRKGLWEVFWVRPQAMERHDASGFAWASAEILYAVVDQDEFRRTRTFEIDHCLEGQLLLDLRHKRFQLGCPAREVSYRLVKTKDRRPPNHGDNWPP